MKRYQWIKTTSLFNELEEQAREVDIDFLPNTAEIIGRKRTPNGHTDLYQMPNGEVIRVHELA